MEKRITDYVEIVNYVLRHFDNSTKVYLICFSKHVYQLNYTYVIVFGKLKDNPYSDYQYFLVEHYPSPYFEAGYGMKKCYEMCNSAKEYLEKLGYKVEVCCAGSFGVIDLYRLIKKVLCRCVSELICEYEFSVY